MEFVKRPSAKDTDEDLLNLQAEFAASREKVPSTKIIRPKAKLVLLPFFVKEGLICSFLV